MVIFASTGALEQKEQHVKFGRSKARSSLAAVLSSSKLQACVNDGSEELECDKKVSLFTPARLRAHTWDLNLYN